MCFPKHARLIRKNILPEVFVFVIFLGGIFFTSGKFINATQTPKFYFVAIFIIAGIMTATVCQKRLSFLVFRNKTVLWGINILLFLQACYGLMQFIGWTPSNHSRFSVTGSFDNPAGFAAVLSAGIQTGYFLFANAKRVERCLALFISAVIAIAVFLSNSRTGMLAVIISSTVFWMIQTNNMRKFWQLRRHQILILLILFFFIAVSAFILYYLRRDSANGRILIWKISFEMVKDKPVFGHGAGAFPAKYMEFQADYFKNNPCSKYAYLADNVKHPFNEFLKITIEFGLSGLLVLFLFILFFLGKIVKNKGKDKALVFSGLLSFLVIACLSYPMQYVACWLLLVFYHSAFLPSKEIKIRNTLFQVVSRVIIVTVCIFSLYCIFRRMRSEMDWKKTAVSSLKENTEEILTAYKKLYSTSLKHNPFFLYNYGAVLNAAGKFASSIKVLNECQKYFNDYDLQLFLADNYKRKGNPGKAIQIYKHASNMIPCRFIPLYQIFEIYKGSGQKDVVVKYANRIIRKKVKVPSLAVNFIKTEAKNYLKTVENQ